MQCTLTLLISMTTLADEVQVALSVTQHLGQTWEDENGENTSTIEDNKFISYWNGNGLVQERLLTMANHPFS